VNASSTQIHFARALDEILEGQKRIEHRLDGLRAAMWLVLRLERRILRTEEEIMADEAALDQAIGELGNRVDDLRSAADAIIAKLQSTPAAPELQDEIDALTQASSNLSATTDALTAAAAPPPTEGGSETQPPAEGAPV
jgi:chromosome segregation ATPase